MEIVAGKDKKISHYEYGGKKKRFEPSEIIHTRENCSDSIYRGESRLKSAKTTIRVLYRMITFQEAFFENGAVPGLILTTPNALGSRIKAKMVAEFKRQLAPAKEGRSPMILDADMKPHPLSNTNFKELDFDSSIDRHEKTILKVLGVPPILLDGGNNANIRPNLQLFYETTIMHLATMRISALEAFFAYDLEPDLVKVRALRPELQEAGNYYGAMVNNGIMTINEARIKLRLPLSTEEHADELRIYRVYR